MAPHGSDYPRDANPNATAASPAGVVASKIEHLPYVVASDASVAPAPPARRTLRAVVPGTDGEIDVRIPVRYAEEADGVSPSYPPGARVCYGKRSPPAAAAADVGAYRRGPATPDLPGGYAFGHGSPVFMEV